MKKASETDQDGILDEAHLHLGAEVSWDLYGSQRLNPGEVLEDFEERADEETLGRAQAMSVLLDLCLEGWASSLSVLEVGRRADAVGNAVNYRCRKTLPMLGAKKRLEAAGSRDEVRRILDWFFHRSPSRLALGKRIVAIGKFVGYSTFADWSMSDLGRACGETPQAMQERMEALCEAPLRSVGSKGKADWQQGERQRARSSAAQRRSYEDRKKQKTKKKA